MMKEGQTNYQIDQTDRHYRRTMLPGL